MNLFLKVFRFHLMENIRSKAYIVSSLILVIGIIGVFGIGKLIDTEKQETFVLITTDDRYQSVIDDVNNEQIKVISKHVSEEKSVRKQIEKGEIAGAFIVTEKDDQPHMIYIYKNIADDVTLNGFAASVQNNYLSNTMEENNVAETTASLLLTPITIDTEVLKDTSSTFGIVYIFVMLMYFFIIFYGQSIATNIASEKSSRVMEVMLPKVKPIYMMYGKIFATLTTGILQLLFVVATFVFCYLLGWINLQGESLFGLEIDFSNLSFTTILFFFVYFILGYTLYAILYASTGAVVSRMEDLPSVTMPVMMCVIAALFIGIKSMIDPTSVLVTISSYIPFFSPIVTYARMVVGEASWIEISVTIILITATIFIINKFASRLYVNGVMNYKGKVTFKDLFKMVSST